MIRSLIKSADAARKAWRGVARYEQSFRAHAEFSVAGTYDVKLSQPYWVSSERGVYLLRDGQILLIAPVPCYGLAFAAEHFYLSAYFGHYTAIWKGDRQASQKKGSPFRFQELYGYQTLGSNERIHQIFCSRDHLWAANTGRDTLLKFNLHSTQLEAEWPLFSDAFGKPILYDNHHLNSVAAYGELVVFVAYRAGNGSLIGVIHDGQVTGFHYKNKGVHDIFLTHDNFVFCDTFGGNKADSGGWAVDRSGVLDETFFSRPPGRIVRGVAGDEGELVLGHSHKGERRKRFEGHGSLLVLRERKVVAEIVLPCAQVYQVAAYDGTYLKPPSRPPDLDWVKNVFTVALGKPIYHAVVQPLAENAIPKSN